MEILLSKIKLSHLDSYTYWLQPIHKYHQFNGPYFEKDTEKELKDKIKRIRISLQDGNNDPLPDKMMICTSNGKLIGSVSKYWKSVETN